MRNKIYKIIEVYDHNDTASQIYNIAMVIAIVISMIPIALKNDDGLLFFIEIFTTIFFAIDYILRLVTADYKMNNGAVSFIQYPFTPMALIDLLSILPTIFSMSGAFRIFRISRLFKTLKVLKAFKLVRYSKSVAIMISVLKKQKNHLLVVCYFSIGYILMIALIIISIEPDTFPTFFDAVYWAAISLTTVGYGDIYAVSTAGRIITILSSFIGIAIVAMPASIITAGYMNELKSDEKYNSKAK